MTAQRSNARIEGLKAGTPYVVQVRARTVAGYGRYSSPADFSTNLQSMSLRYLLYYLRIYWAISLHSNICNSSVLKLMNIMEAQKLIELEATLPIFQWTEILVEKFMTYD